MVRVVAFRKAVLAGISGAIAMEATLHALTLAGLPSVDMVAELGSVVFMNSRVLVWVAAILAHLAIGVCWAVFYGYFFWARLSWPPPLQGLAFAALPAFLAILIVYPQLELMRHGTDVVTLDVAHFLAPLSMEIVGGLIAGHAVFGLVVGAIYRRPVGYPADTKPALPARRRATRPDQARRPAGSARLHVRDRHRVQLPDDRPRPLAPRRDGFDRAITRCGSATSSSRAKSGSRTSATDRRCTCLRRTGPLRLGLLRSAAGGAARTRARADHRPLPFRRAIWLGNFQNPDIADALAEYAGAFAERYPWVRFYTPVNEMYVCARMSALQGLWNEQLHDEGAFVTRGAQPRQGEHRR